MHTDSAGIFLSKEWVQCLEVNNINPSSSDSKNRQNQVSERFNRTFKKLLRDDLNKLLNTTNNKTNTLQLIGKATKYNFENLKQITQDIIDFYNNEKPHHYLNKLPPTSFAQTARNIPTHNFIFKDKNSLTEEEKQAAVDQNSILDIPEEILLERIEVLKNQCPELTDEFKQQDSKIIVQNLLDLGDKACIPFDGLAKNNNSEQAINVRTFISGVIGLKLKQQVESKHINLDNMDPHIQNEYKSLSDNVDKWQNTDIKFLQTIVLQNRLLYKNIEVLKKDLEDKTNELKLQNEELLNQNEELLKMNKYLVETTE